MDQTLHPVLTVRLYTDRKCFGPGVAELLRRVEALHSLRAAAGDMEMAYSKAWKILKNAEDCMGCKLLSTATGGRHGGGAKLTPEAERLLRAYERYCEALGLEAERLFRELFSEHTEKKA